MNTNPSIQDDLTVVKDVLSKLEFYSEGTIRMAPSEKEVNFALTRLDALLENFSNPNPSLHECNQGDPPMTKLTLGQAALRLSRTLNLGDFHVEHDAVGFLQVRTLRDVLRRFNGTVFQFDRHDFQLVDHESGFVVSLHGARSHKTLNRFTHFTLELTRL